jgi:hypothetical protein
MAGQFGSSTLIAPSPSPVSNYAEPSDGSDMNLASKVYLINRSIEKAHWILDSLTSMGASPSADQVPQVPLANEIQVAQTGIEQVVDRLTSLARLTGQVV